MDLVGEYTVPASREEVWKALNDPGVLKECIPGCESLDKVSETDFAGRLIMKVGAIKARLKGKIELSDIDAPNSYTISGQGQGGVVGFAKGGAKVTLLDAADGETLLRYEAVAQLGGKLAAVGSRVFQGIAKKMADDFFGKLAAKFCASVANDGVPHATSASRSLAATRAVSAISAVMPASAPTATARGFEGTLRDLLWLSIGIAGGVLVTWALMR